MDCIIYATGFEVGTAYTRRSGYDVHGVGGKSLADKWDEGVATLHGMHTHGFPNCFILGNSQTGFTANYPHMLDEQCTHMAYIVDHARQHQHRRVEANPVAEAEWVETIIEKARLGVRFFEECTPGYYNNEGKPGERAGQNSQYGGGPIEFFKLLENWRADGNLEGLDLS